MGNRYCALTEKITFHEDYTSCQLSARSCDLRGRPYAALARRIHDQGLGDKSANPDQRKQERAACR